MKKKHQVLFILLSFILINIFPAFAGGPLVVKNGKGVTYGNRPLVYRYDLGNLGILTNSEAISIIEPLFASWAGLGSSDVKFERDIPGSLSFDVTEKNYDSILNSQDLLGYTPIIFDTDGKLLDSFLGSGAGKSVLGLAGPITVSGGTFANQIAESQGVFNGRFINGISSSSDPESSEDALRGTIIHEFGHAFGLDHSQINVDAIRPSSTQELKDATPLMFPIAVNDLFLIRRDDESAAAQLYGNSVAQSNFGKIEGKLLRVDGKTPVLGGNVIARNINNSTLEAVSCVSDYLATGTGSFVLSALPPGSYTIEIEPIDSSFTGGSGVGPYSASKADKSFQDPVPSGYYTGPNLGITKDPSKALIVNVTAGQTISSVNIIASTATSTSSSSSTGGQTTNISEVEPNNLISQAQAVSLPTVVSGTASSADDGELELSSDTGAMITISDLYKITLTDTGSINALLNIESISQQDDLDLVLFDATGDNILDTSSQNGNTDESINKTLNAGTYLLGVGAFTGASAYELEIMSNISNNIPTVTVAGSDTIVLSPVGMNFTKLVVNGSNFTSKTPCSVLSSDTSFLMPKPVKFSLSPSMTQKVITVRVPLIQALTLLSNNLAESVTISVLCNNQASDEKDILLTPSSLRSINRKWKISH